MEQSAPALCMQLRVVGLHSYNLKFSLAVKPRWDFGCIPG